MKATLGIEYIGERQDAELALFSAKLSQVSPGLGRAVVGNTRPRKPWVAKIIGRDSKFGMQREFLPSNWSRNNANGQHSRGVYLWFVLESGQLYEVKSPVSWRNHDRYFCTVTESGDIVRLTPQEADQWLKDHSA